MCIGYEFFPLLLHSISFTGAQGIPEYTGIITATAHPSFHQLWRLLFMLVVFVYWIHLTWQAATAATLAMPLGVGLSGFLTMKGEGIMAGKPKRR